MVSSSHEQMTGEAPSMREAIERFDWSTTPLGPIDEWPAPLRFAVDLCLRSTLPVALYWGEDFRLLYNDAWAAFQYGRHPWALGQKGQDVWGEIWHIVGPQLEQVRRTGEGFSTAETMLPMIWDGILHQTYWSYSLTAVMDEGGAVAGVINMGNEVTKAAVAEQRLSYQVKLADALRECAGPEEVKATAARLLGEHLGATRVGYSEVDTERQILTTSTCWTRDSSIPSLVGVTRLLGAFGESAHAWLLQGNPLVVADHRTDPRTSDPQIQATFEGIGARSMIVIPLVGHGALRAILYVHEIIPRQWTSLEVEIARDTAGRTWDAVQRAQSENSLRESEDHYRHAVELNPSASWTALPDGPINRMSPRWGEWTGTSGIGERWIEAFHPDDVERAVAARAEALRTGGVFDVEHRLRQRDGTYRWYRSRCYPRLGADGRPILWYGTTEDIDSRHRAEEHQRLLINELNHRVKNTLATVQAIAFQTLKGDITLAEARARFEARLLALSRAHNLLTEANWEGAPIWRVVADSIAHLSSEKGRFILEGEPMWLAPRAALALALACHELSTNAVKYGALSDEHGHVEVRWHKNGGSLCIEWKEKGGPPVIPPSGRGFGSRLIERGLAGDLDGKARLDFEPDGLRCMIEAPLSAILARQSRGKTK